MTEGPYDPAYNAPLPPIWALDVAARNAGYEDWFSVPTTFKRGLYTYVTH